jgi:glycerol kinase
VARPAVLETTALGAGFLAGLAEGVWRSRSDVAASWRLDREFLPGNPVDTDERHTRWQEAVRRSLGWAR